jgi:hypothetical protein
VNASPDDAYSGAATDPSGAPSADEDPVASGDAPVDNGEGDQPAGDEAQAREGDNEIPVPGESGPAAEHDMSAIQSGEAQGPNTAESVEGTPEDEAHDAANNVEEGSPEDQVADQELAAVLNAGGHVAGGAGDQEIPAPVAPSGVTSGPTADGGHEVVLPLRISIKVGERAKAYDSYHAAMKNLFTPGRG